MITKYSFVKAVSVLLITVLLALSAVSVSPVQAEGTVTVCTEDALRAALSGGGTVLFDTNCSTTPITLSGTVVISANTTIDGNGHKVTISGGNAVRVFTIDSSVTLTLIGLHITNGASATEGGGAVYVNSSGKLTAIKSAFTNSNSMGNNGGAIFNDRGTLDITNSTFSGNVTGGTGNRGQGGAIYNSGGSVTLTNSTLSGNVARTGGGGGIYARTQTGGTVPLNTTIRNTILSNNQGDNCQVGAGITITDGGGNISYKTGSTNDTTCPTGVNGSTADPKLSTISDYGSLTPLFALGTGSSAVNLAIANCPDTDQRNATRSTPICDSGSYEYRIPTTLALSTSGSPSIYGQYVTFTAAVTPSTATGTVTFAVDGVPMGIDQPITSGMASTGTSFLSANTHVISATYNGDVTYEISSTSLTNNQVVNKAPLTIKADDKGRLYGVENPPLTYTAIGLVNSEDSTVLHQKPYCVTTATISSPASDTPYPITCSGAGAANYTITYVAGNLTIAAHMLTITAQDTTRSYGSANPAFTYSISDPGVTLTTPPTCISAAGPSSSVTGNPYTIRCSGAAAPNYGFNYVDGSLTITKITLTVTANAKTRAYGALNPTLDTVFAGFANGEGAGALSNQPECTTGAVSSSPARSHHPITCSNAAAANYDFNYLPGDLYITEAALTVKAGNLSKTYGAAVPALTPTITGLANDETEAVFTSPVVCTTAATDASPVAVTAYPVTCSGGAADNYTFTYQDGGLTITRAPLTIKAEDKNKTYGAALPLLTYTVNGLVNGDTESAITGAVICTSGADAASPVRETPYPITCSGGSAANYSLSYLAGGMTVNPAVLTVTAANKSKLYNDPLPGLTYAISGFVGSEGESVVAPKPLCTTTATAASPVSTTAYPITCSGAGAANYTFAYQSGGLTINPVTLTVAIDNKTRAYGAPSPVFTYSFSGYVNGEGDDKVTTKPICSSTALPTSPAGGHFPIDCAGAAATNYTFSYQPGDLSITRAALTIKADNQNKAYGSPLPALTHTVLGLANGETEAVFTSPVTCTTTGVDNSPVSATYPITCSGGAASNYAFTAYEPAVLTVVKAELTVTADNKVKHFHEENPPLTYTITGFVNGEDATTGGVTGSAVLDTTADLGSSGGTYPIFVRLGSLSAANYTFKLVHGTLTVVEYQIYLPIILR